MPSNDAEAVVDVDAAASPAQTKDAEPEPEEFDRPIAELDTKYPFQMSTWDASLFIGHKSVGCAGSVVMTLTLLATIVIQGGFCFIAVDKLSRSQYGDAVTKNLEWWRTDAHLKQYGQGGVSLVDRVCNADPTLMVGTDVKAKVAMIKDYIPEFADSVLASGPFMVLLALAIWYSLQSKEIHNVVNFTLAMVQIPKGPRTKLIKTADGGIEMAALGKVRIFVVAFLILVRLTIAALLCYAGTLRTAYTTNWGGILLNAMKLNFIATVPDVLFGALMPQNVKAMFPKLKPLKRPPVRSWKGLDTWSCTVWVVIPVGLVIAYFAVIAPEVSYQLDAYNALCDGDRTFQWTEQQGVVVWMSGDKFQKGASRSGIVYMATEEIRDLQGAEPSGPMLSIRAPSDLLFGTLEQQGPNEIGGILNPECMDMPLRDPATFHWAENMRHVDLLQWATGNQSVSRCADVAHHCTTGFAGDVHTNAFIYARRFCSMTCKCDVPNELYDRSYCGVLSMCDSGTKSITMMRKRSCEDLGVAELSTSSAWQSLARQVGESVTVVPPELRDAAGAAGLLPLAMDDASRNAVLAAENMSLEAAHEFVMVQLGCGYISMAQMLAYSVLGANLKDPCGSPAVLFHCPITCWCNMMVLDGCPPCPSR